MDPQQIGLFELAARRLDWTTRQQAALAQNVANANTPGFQPREMIAFADTLSQVAATTPVRTNPLHLVGTLSEQENLLAPREQVRSIDGNGVTLDQQLAKVADAQTMQTMVTTIYKKYLGWFSLALGKASGS
jgi:flagellar basal-body rod protein FlgB